MGNQYHGYGIFESAKVKQQGLFRKGLFIHGKINTIGESNFEGSLTDGMKQGRGKYESQNGIKYEGYFYKDKFDGEGHLTVANQMQY